MDHWFDGGKAVTAEFYGLLLFPIAAILTGLVVWLSSRNQVLEDGALLRDFLIVMTVCSALVWGISRSDAVRMRIDPVFRIQTEIENHPVYAAIKRFSPDEHQKLQEALVHQLAEGISVPQAFLRLRPFLTRFANERLGFADQATQIAWGRVTVASLRELQAVAPEVCYRALSSQGLGQDGLETAFSAENTREFEQVVVAIYETADRGMRRQSPAEDKPAELDDIQQEYRIIMDTLKQSFGEAVVRRLMENQFAEVSAEPVDRICAARIAQYDAMLERPKAIAATMIDSVSRWVPRKVPDRRVVPIPVQAPNNNPKSAIAR